ncbi:MAG: OmpA family protein [Deltaproteobacteria bacterium]|nr:OmpA family protein [Deltaproteobacteria bacterium]
MALGILAYISALLSRLSPLSLRGAGALARLLARVPGSKARQRHVVKYGGKAAAARRHPSSAVRGLALSVSCFYYTVAALLILLPSVAWAQVPVGTVISNTAEARYLLNGEPKAEPSNTVSVTTVKTTTPAKIEFMKYAPAYPSAEKESLLPTEYYASKNKAYVPVPNPTQPGTGAPLDVSAPVPLVDADFYQRSEPVFVKLTDIDKNADPTKRESVLVTLTVEGTKEFEILRLWETGPDTGTFAGYIKLTTAAAMARNGLLSIIPRSVIIAKYTDRNDGTDIVAAAALIDPYGVVFDSTTGKAVNGATVTLIDATTGAEAAVKGDDGKSKYPATVITGGTAKDSSGKVYAFGTGEYRYPFITTGQYKLVVVPPPGYRSPSQAATKTIQALPGAPFAIVEPGSRGEAFFVNPGPTLHIDIPIDPVVRLYLTKSASKDIVSPGDFLQYKLLLEDTVGGLALTGVVISDKLPPGFRYRKGSAKIDGSPAPDPAISGDGRTLTFTIGGLAVSGKVTVTYVAEVGAVVKTGPAANVAQASADGGLTSNVARAVVKVVEDLFMSKTIIVGRVAANGCGDDEGVGMEGIRVYLEDGTNVITDKNGMYHFEGVTPGTHVVQVDLYTVPTGYTPFACEENTRFAGTPHSQFVDLQPGAMWRADFSFASKDRSASGVAPREGGGAMEMEPAPPPALALLKGGVSISLKGALREDGAGKDGAGKDGAGKDGAGKDGAEGGVDGIADYSIDLRLSDVPLKNLRLTILLPEGASYMAGSSMLGGSASADPEVTEGVLVYRLGDAAAGWENTVRFSTTVKADGASGEMPTKAVLLFDTSEAKNKRTPVVETTIIREMRERGRTRADITLRPHFDEVSAALKAEDLSALDSIIESLKKADVKHIAVVGHTDSNRIRERSRHIYVDNKALSMGRAASVARYIAAGLGFDPSRVTIAGKGPDEPVAGNATEAGRARNRRVELAVLAERRVLWPELKTGKADSGIERSEVTAVKAAPGVAATGVKASATNAEAAPGPYGYAAPDEAMQAGRRQKEMPVYDKAWLDEAKPGLEWLWPHEDYNPSAPSLKIAIKHDPSRKITLLLGGAEVDPLNFDGALKRKDGVVAASFWSGVDIKEGDNVFEAVESADGVETGRLRAVIHYSGSPVKAVFLPEASRLTADGKVPPVIAVRLTDKDGKPVREGLVGEFTIDPPYAPFKKIDELQAAPLEASKNERTKYTAGEDGIALIRLAPTTDTGEALVKIYLSSGTTELRSWLTPELRDWILVGLAEGTAGYDTLSGNMEAAADAGASSTENLYEDGRLTFFAKGKIKGDYLLTMAYDSEKNGRMRDNKSLYQTIDPGTYYTVYGDATAQRYDAASARALYVKIERDRFYALFGDYDTGLTVTELSRYARSFNGFKSEYKGEQFDWNVFAADTNQAFVKDEIRGDGTAGLYKLSRKNIVMNSETVTIEARDRFHSEVIVSSQTLARHLDYDIDYDAGTMYFKTPVYSRDENFNPVYIVAGYESNDSTDLSWNYGGRGAVRFLDGRVETGVTHVHEGGIGGEGNLIGADAAVRIDDKTRIKTEYAESLSQQYGVALDGNAYAAEVTHKSENIDTKAYVREQSKDFGLGQQRGSEGGTRKYGFDGAYKLTPQSSVSTDIYRQQNIVTGAQRDVAEARARYGKGGYDLHTGLRHAEDAFTDGTAKNSDQMLAGATYRLFNDKVTLRLDRDQSIGGNNESGDYPTRTVAGVDYKLSETASVNAEHEITQGSTENAEMTRLGLRASPWNGAQMSSGVGQEHTEVGTRLFSTNGLKQSWQVTEKVSVDAGVDKTTTHRHPGNAQVNNNAAPASGADTDFAALSLGAAYKEKKWSAASRFEVRDSSAEDKAGIALGAAGEPTEGLGLSAGLRLNRTASYVDKKRDALLRLGAAWRPKKTRLIILDRLDLIANENSGADFSFHDRKAVNNMNVNYKLDSKAQISLQYGAKYVAETIDKSDYTGYTDLIGIEGRYDVTQKWDVGIRTSVLHSWYGAQYRYCTGASVGYNFAKNVWVSAGYNFTGFKDKDFSKADFTAKGPFVKFRMKFDQESASDALKWFAGQ